MIEERGPWRVATYPFTDGGALRVDIQSDDFTHDAALTVTGDFVCVEQKIAYAEEIARRLNDYHAAHTGGDCVDPKNVTYVEPTPDDPHGGGWVSCPGGDSKENT